jgi:hypothetical protein
MADRLKQIKFDEYEALEAPSSNSVCVETEGTNHVDNEKQPEVKSQRHCPETLPV